MKKIIKFMLVLALVATMSLVMFACDNGGDKDGNSYTLVVWGAENDQAMLKQMCNAYAAANPQNTYKFLYGVQAEADAADKVLNDVQSGPDVFSFASDQINKLIGAGALARVGGDIEAQVKANNTAASVDSATVNIGGTDMLYAYPSTGDNCYFLYYDKSVLSETDVQTMDGIMARLAEVNKTMHFKLDGDGWYLSSFFFADETLKYDVQFNDNMAEESVSINYNTPAGFDALKAIYTYMQQGLVVNTDDTKILAGVRGGTVAAAVSGTWNAKQIEEVWGENMGVVKLPTATIGGVQKQLTSYFGYKLMGVSNFSKNKGEAHKLALWLTNQQNQLLRYETRGFGPTNSIVADMEQVKNDKVLSAVFAQQAHSRTQKGVPSTYWTPMSSLITPMVTAVENGTEVTDETLQAYLDSLVQQISKSKTNA